MSDSAPVIARASRRSPVSTVPGAATVLLLRNRQKDRPLQVRVLRQITLDLLEAMGLEAEVGFHFVSPREMARVNWRFLQHEGSTDVITFDHGSTPERLYGECFVSVADAVEQAQAFRTTWTEEVVRYVIHGILHLRGYDDLEPALRRSMKREENRWVRWVSRRHEGLETPPAAPVRSSSRPRATTP